MWYYASNGQQQGPFDDGALDRLVAAGTITNETLVWKEGMVDWSPLRQVRAVASPIAVADAKSSTCMMCGKQVGAENLIDLLGIRVCAACKPMAVQTLKEGGTPAAKNAAWRQGKNVVTHNQNSLPSRCYKCNEVTTGPAITRKLYWHPPAYYLLIFLHIFIYVIVAIIVRKRATVDVHLCDRHKQRRRYFTIGGWSGTGVGILMFVWGIVENQPLPIIFGIFILLAALIGGLWGAALARASRIKGDTVWLRGAGKEFLASLPEWPG